jgi:hypothetical protein
MFAEDTPPADGRSKPFRRGLALALLGALFGGLLGLAANPDDPSLGAAQYAGAGFLIGSMIAALQDWRTGLGLLILIVLAEDSLRKALPGAPYAVSLGKDLLVALCYVSWLFRPRDRISVRRASRLEQVGVYVPLVLWALFVIAEAFNPHLPHILVGFSGVRTWLLFVPLIGLCANVFRDGEAERVVRWLAYLAIPLFLIALMQNVYYDNLPPFLANSAFAKFRGLESGATVRYNESIFASPTLFALACVYQLCLVVGLLKMHRPPRQRVLLWISGYCAVMSAHLSGVRTGLLFAAVAIAAMLPLLLFPRERQPDGTVRRGPGLVLGGIIGLLLGVVLVGSMKETRAEAFWTSLEVNIIGERIEESVAHVGAQPVPPLGNGTGAAGKSGQVMALLGREPMGFENVEWGNLLVRYCFGPVGMWVAAILLAWFMGGLLAVATRNRQGRFAALRYTLWIYLAAQMGWFLFKAYPVMENGTMVAMFWTSAGLIIGLGRLDEQSGFWT